MFRSSTVKKKDEDPAHALNAALRLLTRREYSILELYTMKFLDDNPAVADEIEQKIREYYKNNNDYDDTASIGSSEAENADSADLDGLGPDVDTDDLITPIPDDL